MTVIAKPIIIPGQVTCTSTTPYRYMQPQIQELITLRKSIIPLAGNKSAYSVGDKIIVKIDVKSSRYMLKNIKLREIIPSYFEFKREIKITSKTDKEIIIRTKRNLGINELELIVKIDKLVPEEKITLRYLIIPKVPGQHIIPSTTCYVNEELMGSSNILVVKVTHHETLQSNYSTRKLKSLITLIATRP